MVEKSTSSGVYDGGYTLRDLYVNWSGLSSAMVLFDRSELTYTKEHFTAFALLTSVLANPLCNVIFEARLRSSGSDYVIVQDPLNKKKSCEIMQELDKLSSQEERIAAFYDFFTAYRAIPASLKYFREISLEEVLLALNTFCEAMLTTNMQGHAFLMQSPASAAPQNINGLPNKQALGM